MAYKQIIGMKKINKELKRVNGGLVSHDAEKNDLCVKILLQGS